MRTIRRTFANLSQSTLLLGKAGENRVTKLEIDVSKEQAEFSNPSFELILKLPNFSDPYPVLVEISDGKMTYSFTGSDLAKSGDGELEALVLDDEGNLLKSATAKTIIEPSIVQNEYPGPLQRIIDEVRDALGKIESVEEDLGEFREELSQLQEEVSGLIETDTLVPLTLGTEYNLQIRQNWTDVPIYLTAEESYRIGLQTGVDSTEDLIRLYEASDFSTGLPCPLLRVKRGDDVYVFIPRAFTSISQSYDPGWYDAEDNPVDAPSLAGMTFGAFDVGGTKYTDLTDLPEKARLALETLSRIFNVSTDAMGSLGAIEDGVQRFQGEISVNRKYAFSPADIAVLTLPTVPWTAEDAQFVLYLHCANNTDVTFPSGTLFAGGDAPNTEAGEHKLIGSWLRDAQAWAVGGVDYAGVS